MLISSGVANKMRDFNKDNVITINRSGVASKLVLPVDIISQTKGDLDVNEQDRSINLTGDQVSVYLIADKIGVGLSRTEDALVNIFFLDGDITGMVLEIVSGEVYFEAPDLNIYGVNKFGDLIEPSVDKKINWITTQYVLSLYERILQYRYNITPEQAVIYGQNSLVTSQFKYNKQPGEEPAFSVHFREVYTDIALEQVSFMRTEQEEPVVTSIFDDEQDEKDPADFDIEEVEEEDSDSDNFNSTIL